MSGGWTEMVESDQSRYLITSVRLTARVMERCRSLRLDVCELDHRGPFFGGLSDQFAKFLRRHLNRLRAQFDEARLDRRIGDDPVDVLVELVDDVGRGPLRRANSEPAAALIAQNEFGDGGNVR